MKTAAILAAALLALLEAPLALAQVSISVSPSEIDNPALIPGSVVTVTVSCDGDGTLLRAADFGLAYDPTLLEFQSSIRGAFWGGADPLMIRDGVVDVPGHFEMVGGWMDAYPAVPGGVLAQITFVVVGTGSTGLVPTGSDPAGAVGVEPQFSDDSFSVIPAEVIVEGLFSNSAGGPDPEESPSPSPGAPVGGGGGGGGCSARAPGGSILFALALLAAAGRMGFRQGT